MSEIANRLTLAEPVELTDAELDAVAAGAEGALGQHFLNVVQASGGQELGGTLAGGTEGDIIRTVKEAGGAQGVAEYVSGRA